MDKEEEFSDAQILEINLLTLEEQIASRLYDHSKESLDKTISPFTKALIVKDKFHVWIKEVERNLNDCFENVQFSLGLIRINPYQDRVAGQYDKQWADDDDYIYLNDDRLHEGFYDLPLTEMWLEIKYTLRQQCSLGHTHFRKRFHLYSPAQWTRMIATWELGQQGKEFIKEYIDDFFFEV